MPYSSSSPAFPGNERAATLTRQRAINSGPFVFRNSCIISSSIRQSDFATLTSSLNVQVIEIPARPAQPPA